MKFRPVTLERRIIPLIILLLCLLLIIPVIIVSLTTRPAQDGGVSLEKSGQAHTINVFVTAENKVKAMDLEDYITSVVAGEMPATYYPEALKAQACAARTFAVSRMESGGCNRAKNADVCTDSGHCQAYVSPEKMKSNWGGEYVTKYNKVKDAVQETQGDVIIYEGKPISALYFSTSGGYTEDSENVFSSAVPYLRSVKSDGEEAFAPRFYGEVRVSYGDFAQKLKGFNSGINISKSNAENSVSVIKRSDTGRVEQLSVGGKTLTGRELRGIFDLNSTNFKITYEDGNVVFNTIGFGHGVGMSQTGANAMAKNGSNFEQILKHYYTGVQIVPMDDLKDQKT